MCKYKFFVLVFMIYKDKFLITEESEFCMMVREWFCDMLIKFKDIKEMIILFYGDLFFVNVTDKDDLDFFKFEFRII